MRRRLAALAALMLLVGCRSAPPAEPVLPADAAGPHIPKVTPAAPVEATDPRDATAPSAAVAEAAPAPDAAAARPPDRFERPTVIFETASGDVPVTVELARTPEEQAQGLMYRQYLPDGQGMLFIFPGEAVHSFWMKNTLIELDMIHISTDGRVVGVVERAEPETLTARRVGVPARYVLEVPGGWSRRLGIAAGTKVRFASLAAAD